jgi:putative transposase
MGRRLRNLLKDETTFFVTSTIVDFFPVFKNHSDYLILIENLNFYRDKFDIKLFGIVLMPNHYHLLVQLDNSKGQLSKFQQDFKKFTARKILEKLCEKERLHKLKIFENAARNLPKQKHKVWMDRFDDEVIKSGKWFFQKLNYIHNNPVADGLVELPEDRPYSSARNYSKGDHSIIKVDIFEF